MKRIYEKIILQHFKEHKQMLFLIGPRQVGKKTVSAQVLEDCKERIYFNWDNQSHRTLIMQGADTVALEIGLQELSKKPVLIIFDEIHKYAQWKDFIKGFYDTYSNRVRILITVGACLDFLKRGGDSLMGRYLRYRCHPLTVGELLHSTLPTREIRPPHPLAEDQFEKLFTYGGVPDPFLKRTKRFWNQWKGLRTEQLFREDMRDLTRIQ